MYGIGRRNVYDFGFQGTALLKDFYRRMPAYRIPGRWPFRWMLEDLPFRHAQSYSSNIQVVPPNGEDLFLPGESKEDQLSVGPEAFLRYVSGNSNNAAGFRWQLLNGDTDEVYADSPIRDGIASGQSVAPLSTPGPFLLTTLQPWPSGANLIVRLTNLNLTAGSSTRIQLAFFFAAPIGRIGG